MNLDFIKKLNFNDGSIGVRKMISILLTITFCYLSIVGKINSEQFVPIFSMIIGYYFGKSTALDIPGKNKDNIEK
ncbi:hypothetical protein [Romboutsia sp.]|uniref:hypothetical protein n=1 Tax=Romboutsia sp. TaxID=1965302 RepID=UPI003F2E7B1D